MAPGVNKARQWLSRIYREHLNKPELAEQKTEAMEDHMRVMW